jgi:hypothetical protein
LEAVVVEGAAEVGAALVATAVGVGLNGVWEYPPPAQAAKDKSTAVPAAHRVG